MELNQAKKDYSQPMHTAEHILNQTMIRLFGCGRSITNHIEKKKSKCDYKFPRALTDEDIVQIETKVNEIIAQNLDVSESFVDKDEAAAKFNLEKLPANVSQTLRIISVGNYDACPCIGAHVANTSEIGIFKIISTDFNEGVLRIRYKVVENN